MFNLVRRCGLLALLVLACVSKVSAAEVEPCRAAFQKAATGADAGAAYGLLVNEFQAGCIRGATDTTGVEQLVISLIQEKSPLQVVAKRSQLFDALIAEFGPQPPAACAGDSSACIVGRHVSKLKEVNDLLTIGQPHFNDPLLNKNAWTVVMRDGAIGISDVRLQPYLASECESGLNTDQCLAAVENAAKMMRSTLATLEIIAAHSRPIIAAAQQFLSTRDKEWDSYFNEVSVQYPWELWLNGLAFQKKLPRDERAAFPRAPQSKFIVLHPVAAFENAKTGPGERSTQAAIVVEVLGIERWRWQEGVARNRIGASLAMSFSQVPGADDIGYGVVFHTPVRNASIGVVCRDADRGDSINLVFNMDFAKLIQQYQTLDVRDFIGAAQK